MKLELAKLRKSTAVKTIRNQNQITEKRKLRTHQRGIIIIIIIIITERHSLKNNKCFIYHRYINEMLAHFFFSLF